MTEDEIYGLNEKITGPDRNAYERAVRRWNTLAKPLGGLGILEDTVCQIAGIRHSEDVSLAKSVLYVICADNGVVKEGVSQCGSEATTAVASALARGESTVNYMAKGTGCRVAAVDAGMADPPESEAIMDLSIRKGSGNIARESAMTVEEGVKCIENGVMLTKKAREKGAEIILCGEMGIGNTTTSSALCAALLDKDPEYVTGRGAGLSDEGLRKKIKVIGRSLERISSLRYSLHNLNNRHYIRLLSELGGFDIAVLTGICIGGGLYDMPVLLDGFISMTAALLAVKITPACKKSLIGSHSSAEPAVSMLEKELGIRPFIDAGMRLGEGTGAVTALKVLQTALCVYNSGHTFDNIGIEAYKCLH